ncbi:MAG TPA: hypothetical protein VNZ01_04995 [Solirubrobacteraceae bacterium]|jgi:hypothetical protein|nr:hypothetical protein [Solirubrobacteraceae bacterium]
MSQETVRTYGPTDPLGPPRLTIYNTAERWLTLKNYDLVFYENAVLIVLGLTARNLRREMRRRREVRRAGFRRPLSHVPAGNAERSAYIAATPVPATLAEDRGNRLVPLDEIESAGLSRRLGMCKLKLRLTDETHATFIWANLSVNANYDHVTETLTDLLPERFRAS